MADLATAYLLLVPSLKGAQKTIESELGGIGEGAGKKAGDGLGQGILANMGEIAGKAAAAFAAVFSAKKLFDFGKASFDAYAEFEQLAGGAEKIFDQLDQAKILDDANSAFLTLNMSANEYLAAINQTGAMFSQTMGDEKGYDTAKRGMQAISDYATGTGRDINELNSKFGMITRSTSSYQSIADQFAGILPATSADFLKQAKAAGFLSDAYTSLTDVPVAEYQQAVTQMLEKGVADLGLAGNTAKESLTTLSGSMLATKSAWQNLVTEIGKPDADIGARISDMMTALMGGGEGGGLLANVVGEIGTIAKNMVSGLGTALSMAVDWAVANGPTLMARIGETIATNGPALLERLAAMRDLVVQWFVTSAPTIVESVAQTVYQFLAWLTSNGPMLVDKIAELVGLVRDWLVANGPAILAAAWEMFSNIGMAIVTYGPTILTNVATTIGSVIGYVISAAAEMLQAGIQLVQGLLDGSTQEGEAVRQFFADLPSNILAALGDLSSFLVSAGSQIVQGLIDGIQGSIGGVAETLLSGIQGAIDEVLGFLGIASPSKLFAWVGDMSMQGLSGGIEDGAKLAAQATQDAVSGVYDAAVGGSVSMIQKSMGAAISDAYKAQPLVAAQRPVGAPVQAGGWSEVADAVSGLRGDMGSLGIYLDGKTLVGGIATRMDRALVM